MDNVESQEIVQEISPDPLPVSNEASLAAILGAERRALVNDHESEWVSRAVAGRT